MSEALRESQLKRFPMIQVVDRYHQQTANQRQYQESWFFTSLPSAIDAVVNNLGCGWLPQSEIESHLADGTLKVISRESRFTRATSLYLIKSEQVRYDICVQALADALQFPEV
ncbi:LysR substrate-binding domain-containing protein [Vibrio olivae]